MTRTVLVTGASSGIGIAAAQALAADGWHVYAGVRSDAGAQALAREAGITPLRLDVTKPEEISVAIAMIGEREGALDALINNAGVATGGPLEYIPLDEYRRIFDVNLFGVLAVTQAALPLLRRSASPRIVLVGSISGRLAIPYLGPYSASKFALRATAEALRVELAPAVSVSLIEPASVKTPIWRKGREQGAAMRAWLPPEAPPHYRRAVESVLRTAADEERRGMPVERVTRAIRHALSSNPRPAYLVGGSARAGSILALLPAWVRDRWLRRAFR